MATSEKRVKLPVFTVEECQSCHIKTKRQFKMGDYVYTTGNACQSCKSTNTLIVAIFAEQPTQR